MSSGWLHDQVNSVSQQVRRNPFSALRHHICIQANDIPEMRGDVVCTNVRVHAWLPVVCLTAGGVRRLSISRIRYLIEGWFMTHRRITTRVGELAVEMEGEGPPAVLWHSLMVDSCQWDRVRAELRSHRTLIVIDGPGHGASGPPPAGFTRQRRG